VIFWCGIFVRMIYSTLLLLEKTPDMNLTQLKPFKIFVGALILVLVFFAGANFGESKNPSVESDGNIKNKEFTKPESVDFSDFWKIWNLINEKHVPPATSTDAVSDQEKVWGAITGLVASLNDPHTVFLPPAETKIFEADVRGNFEGVGMEIGIRDSVLTVIAPLKSTPAQRAGIQAGDKIIKIGEKTTLNMTAEEAVSLIRGERGTEVVFTIVREGEEEPLEIRVVRDVIDIPTINSYSVGSGNEKVFVIELYNFSSVAPDQFRNTLRDFIDARTDKLLLDLRGNPGGYLEASIDMASWFLPPGEVVVREDFGNNQKEVVYRSKGYDIFTNELKMVVLVDVGSASASEILAGALKEHGRAKIVGQETFGKGSVQELIKITPETSLKITIARWLTPEGVSISEHGITPDFLVEIMREDVEKEIDLVKEKGLDVLRTWSQ